MKRGVTPLFSTDGFFAQMNINFCAILVEGIMGDFSVKLFGQAVQRMSFKDISIFSYGGHCFQQSINNLV